MREAHSIGFRSSFSGRARWTDVKAMLGMESWVQKPTCRGPRMCPGAPHPSTLRVEREGPPPFPKPIGSCALGRVRVVSNSVQT